VASDTGWVTAEPSTLTAPAAETVARCPRVDESSMTSTCARLESMRAAAASFSVRAVPATSSKMYPTGLTGVVPSVNPALSAIFWLSWTAKVPPLSTVSDPELSETGMTPDISDSVPVPMPRSSPTIWVLTPARSLSRMLSPPVPGSRVELSANQVTPLRIAA
jgi:hypothetical protein